MALVLGLLPFPPTPTSTFYSFEVFLTTFIFSLMGRILFFPSYVLSPHNVSGPGPGARTHRYVRQVTALRSSLRKAQGVLRPKPTW